MADGSKLKIAGWAATIGSFTAISRVAGLVRDQITAYYFGASIFSDAFYVAFRLPNLLRNFLAEGAMTASFVPQFTDHLVNRGQKAAKELLDSIFTILSCLLLVVTILGVLFAPFLVNLIASGYSGEKFDLTVRLARIMFPYIALVSIMALAMGALNSLKIFMPPAASPIIFNIFWISSFFVMYKVFDLSIYALAIGVIIGGIFQLLFQFPYLKKQGFLFGFSFNFTDPAIKRIAKLLIPAMFGSTVYQINIIINTHLASLIPDEANTYLYYSNRITQLPVGLIIVAFGNAILPKLSEEFAKRNLDEMKNIITGSLKLVLFLTIPATVGIVILRVPILSTLFFHGAFDWNATCKTAFALTFDALGLFAIAGVKIYSTAFFALGDTRTPFLSAFFAMFINIFTGIMLINTDLSFAGLSLAVTLAATFNVFILAYELRHKIGSVGLRGVMRVLLKILLASGCMALAAWLASLGSIWSCEGRVLAKAVRLGAGIAVSIFIYLSVTKMMRMEEYQTFKELFQGKLKKLKG